MSADSMRIGNVLDYWFGPPRTDGSVAEERRRRWFVADPAVDREISAAFGPEVERAARGELEAWKSMPRGRLALVILLDQFSRTVWRGTRRAFAQDAQALAILDEALEAGVDRALGPYERAFLFMPLEHAEDRQRQRRAVERFEALAREAPDALRRDFEVFAAYARRHRDVVERFGRFPHRNAVLGRESTPEEVEFLATSEPFG
jgi:uncharacterized protein (DUF924 family)